jgi:hypothetical protein
MVGKIFITRSGYDPQLGKHVKDPYLGPCPTLGACRPDVREQLKVGDHIFVVSGRVPGATQFVMGGFEIAEKINAREAFRRFPELRLHKLEDGQLTGNIIVNGHGRQHKLDDHTSFERRTQNYIVGTNLLALSTAAEISEGRKFTLEALRKILQKDGKSPHAIVGHLGAWLTDEQVVELREWLGKLKLVAQKLGSAITAP